VRRYEFVCVLGEHQITNLAPGLDRFYIFQLVRVPELDSAILRSAPSGQQALLVRRPRDRLDGSLMLAELGKWVTAAPRTPQQQFVIVTARRQLLVVKAPLEAADLLAMADQFCGIVLAAAQVPVHDAVVAAARAEEGAVPGHGADASIVPA